MSNPIPVYVGFDPREAAAYHVCCQSIINHASVPVSFLPLHKPMLSGFDGQRDGTNAFIFSRYLVPYLQDFNGFAIFLDGDMIVRDDIAKLWALRDLLTFNKAVGVVKHEYKTRHKRKYVGSPIESDNVDYPRKNWSSVMIWNCGHYANRILTPEFVAEAPGKQLHRFEWLKDEQVAALPEEWNVLVGEQFVPDAKLVHYTLGIPGFGHYANSDYATDWHNAYTDTVNIVGEHSVAVADRAHKLG